ncbi:unnamed protein product [Vitrella brassicaformis CCMP3155]|uniref:Ras-related GTP-binding protein n=2 Tax=Vitrella brassicaformis TaxID=1169539 RepID=A0A0G4GDP1_VITBC|nr:unnamed protein product [Vitrella brassicaformis CCMP3155]|mmetsp:Transcript_38856/g.97180  ORF Transcript_38856/g.97180 Transcript_38856/m.97180 type:complete len:367 (+) Transcript_38856:70-1170(+)|eukprot:CEM27533.1 unnamed protein product [Vitrella brassicaformis CCMP3155]
MAAPERIFADDESREIWLDDTPKILMVGLPKAGKTSIIRVIFHKTSPYETFELAPNRSFTIDVQRVATNNLIRFAIGDAPSGLIPDESQEKLVYSKTSALIVVISAQNEPYQAEIKHATEVITRAWNVNKNINFEVFIHKVDGDVFASSDGAKIDCQREIHTNLMEHLYERGLKEPNVTFNATSIYDHTVFEAFSRVVQRLIPQIPTLEQLLDLLVTTCRMEKAFLFDVVSKLFIATDTSSVDAHVYELCSDMIDVVIDVSCIYGSMSDSQYDAQSNCVINLDNNILLYLREVDRFLALVCVVREEYFDRQHMLDYNINVFKDALLNVFKYPPKRPNALTPGPQTDGVFHHSTSASASSASAAVTS